MNSKIAFYVAGLMLLVGFSGYAFVQFNDALTPYVSYEQAIASPRTVQVAGGLQKGSSSYDDRNGRLHFTLVDTENGDATLPVRYEGVKPANFEDAISIVAIGNWDAAQEEFAAHDLLVKCPSKYQGLDDYESKSYSAEAGYADGDEASRQKSYGEKSYSAEGYGEKSYGSPDAGDGGAAPRPAVDPTMDSRVSDRPSSLTAGEGD